MKSLITAGFLAAAAGLATLAAAQPYEKPSVMATPQTPAANVIVVPPVTGAVLPGGPTVIPDGRAMASDREVADARRAYRAACTRHESASFCDCVTAGVAQALAPAEVRMAARTIGDRISAEGDAAAGGQSSDATPNAQSSAARIIQVEGHYSDACQGYRS